MGAKRWTQAELNTLRRMHASSSTDAEIAAALGRSVAAVRTRRWVDGEDARDRRRRHDTAVDQQIARASRTYTSTTDDGTRVVTWREGTFWRARVEHEGAQFVRVDTVEQTRSSMPARHVHRRAAVRSDVVVFKSCTKSALLLWAYEDMRATSWPHGKVAKT